MGRQPGKSKNYHKTERVLRRISMLLRLQRIKARMTSSFTSTSQPQNLAPPPSSQSHPRMVTLQPLPEISLSSLNAILQRSGRPASIVIPQLRSSDSRDSKRSLRFSHRRRHSQQLQRQLERQANSEQQNRPPRVRVVAVVMVPHPTSSSGSGSSRRRSSNSSRRRSSSMNNVMAGRPHVLNMVRRMLMGATRGHNVRESRRVQGDRSSDDGRRTFAQTGAAQQARNERTPEKGNSNGGGDVDDKKMG